MQRRHWLAQLLAGSLAAATTHHGWAQAGLSEGVPVLCSFSILQDLVQAVGGTRVKVRSLVPAGADVHTFEPRPAQLKVLLASRLLVINGLHFEPWAEKMIRAAGYRGQILVASHGLATRAGSAKPAAPATQHGPTDPHAWQDPANVMRYVEAIAEALSSIDPSGTPYYQARARHYLNDLQALDRWITEQIASLQPRQRQVITSHDAFGYFAARYQVRFLAPQGISTEERPSARTVAQLIAQIRRERIRAIFLENMSDPKLMAQMARDTGVKLGGELYPDGLTPPGGPADSYLSMMRHNVNALVAGMRTN
jgi:zinc/manganese transport system substrate-binding protein